MEITYRNANIDDLDFLIESRLDFIHISDTASNYEFIKNNIHQYFEKAFREKQCDIILAESNSVVKGTGIIFYYDSIYIRRLLEPVCHL